MGKIVGICRIRNEQGVIENTLKHLMGKVDEVYVFDDFSTDDTIKICNSFKFVKKIIRSSSWASNPQQRLYLEGKHRQVIYEACLEAKPEWVYYFDADEYVDFENIDFNDTNVGGYSMRFFDYYITPEDEKKHYLKRKFIGPEYRDILTLFRPNPNIRFIHRPPMGVPTFARAGFVKHYGKAISVKQWEDTCDYYINHLFEPQPGNTTISDKWKARKGKAIHTMSDFGNDFIEWKDRKNPSVIIDNSMGQAELNV